MSIVVALHLADLPRGVRACSAEVGAELGSLETLPAGTRGWQKRRTVPAAWLKPGHWTATLAPAEAHGRDVLGQLRLSCVDDRGLPLPIAGTRYRLVIGRPAVLARGQVKRLRAPLFLNTTIDRPAVETALIDDAHRGESIGRRRAGLGLIPSYQYHLVVLARRPRPYASVDRLPSIRPPSDEIREPDRHADYRLALLDPSHPAALPEQSAQWTSIAHVIWDDWPIDRLSADQQQAMLDWLHFGGGLIVSGPASLDTLRGSFLEPFLPARRVGSHEFGKDDLAVLADWRGVDEPASQLASGSIPGIEMELVNPRNARFLPRLGRLFAERRVGRGRVFVSALPLSDPRLTRSPGWDDVFNACLLGRPPRRFAVDELGETSVQWAHAGLLPEPRDAALNTSLRYFARDTGLTFRDYAADVLAERRAFDRAAVVRSGTVVDPDARPRHVAERRNSGGVAAWRDRGPVPDAARRALRDAAGVSVPSRRFVVVALLGYLIVLVPVSWLVFRAIGRPAWIWAAAPVIALATAAVIVPAAGLNLGFVRTRSEIVVIEFQPDWPRAHVTRYTALYTSLATTFTMHFDSTGDVALPMADALARHLGATGVSPVPELKHWQDANGTDASACYTPGPSPTLSGIVVPSHRAGLIHAEATRDFNGPIELIDRPNGSEVIRNRSGLKLRDVTVIAKQRDGRVVTPRRAAARKPISAIDVWPIYELAIDPGTLEPGEVRLVAISDTPLTGMTIRPAAGQSTSVAVVVAHLRYEHGPEPKSDVNAYEASGGY